MIETKEKYEFRQLEAEAWAEKSAPNAAVLQWRAGEALKDSLETIEALRKVARAGRILEVAYSTYDGNTISLAHTGLWNALKALPDWITE